MFSKSKKEEMGKTKGVVPPGTVNIISAGTILEGTLSSNSDIRVDGEVRGHIISENKVVIGEAGVITGDLKGATIEVQGKVVGNIIAKELAVLKTKSQVKGDIFYNNIVIENGANFRGSCNIGNPKETQAPNKEQKTEKQSA